MLDNPKKTEPLLVALKAAVPFEVELMPALIERLRAKNYRHVERDTSNSLGTSPMLAMKAALCAILSHPIDELEALVVSLTHVRMPRTMPLASAVIDYQKHRVKKLRKQGCK